MFKGALRVIFKFISKKINVNTNFKSYHCEKISSLLVMWVLIKEYFSNALKKRIKLKKSRFFVCHILKTWYIVF